MNLLQRTYEVIQSLEKGDFSTAGDLLETIYDADDLFHNALMAQCWLGCGSVDFAMEYAQRAMLIDPESWEAQRSLKLVLARKHQHPIDSAQLFDTEECESLIALLHDSNPQYSQLRADGEGYRDDSQFKARGAVKSIGQLPEWVAERLIDHWFPAFYPFETLLLEYQPGCFFDWHVDSVADDCKKEVQRKRTMSVQLSSPDDYQGGTLEIRDHAGKNIAASRERGVGVSFDAYLHHRACKVTEGTRYAFVVWGTKLTADVVIDELVTLHGVDERAEAYAAKMRDGADFPLPQVFTDGESLMVMDGHHRIAATHLNGSKKVRVQLCPGTKQTLKRYSREQAALNPRV